ncbi:hypothetical protein RIF29_41304 [Crotalaria pallida]|uniref:Uncharacterized protein n=1 Tax=Crotalaria pallida TaxID=3830 RepID=A0AAN9HRH7_CROPI
MKFHKEYLDLILVPCGLIIMFGYHLFLLHRYLNRPHTTVMGFENNDRRAWVERIMQVDKRDVGTALSVIQSNTTAATFLASVSLTLCSLIGAWIANSSNIFFTSQLIYGDTRPTAISIKYICLLICFLLAFACFIQSARHFVHANYLISTPDSYIPVINVETAVIRGSDFWALGLRALYFALDLLLWFFGPIPMFICSVLMVLVLHYLDSNSRPLLLHNMSQAGQFHMAKRDIKGPRSGSYSPFDLPALVHLPPPHHEKPPSTEHEPPYEKPPPVLPPPICKNHENALHQHMVVEEVEQLDKDKDEVEVELWSKMQEDTVR